jgi:hypothetical protein
MKNWEKKLMKHILSEKYLGETENTKMQKEDKKSFLKAVANFHQIGEMIHSNGQLKEITETLNNIVQQAESLTIQESEHWFDNVTVGRHMKQMNEAYKVFEKTANEMSSLQQRLESAYDDMGMVLNRYYNVNNALSEDDKIDEDQYTAGVTDKGPSFDDHMTADKSDRI